MDETKNIFSNTDFDQQRQIEILKRSQKLAGITAWEYNIPSGLLSWINTDGNLSSLNLERKFLLNAKALFGDIIQKDIPGLEKVLKELVQGSISEIEYRLKNNNDLHYYKLNAVVVPDDKGAETIISGTLQNVSDFKKAVNNFAQVRKAFHPGKMLGNTGTGNTYLNNEPAFVKVLDQYDALLEKILENSIDHVIAFDKDLTVSVWNKKCEERTGLLKADVIGKHVLEVFPGNKGEMLLKDVNRAFDGEPIHREENSDEYDGIFEMFISPITLADSTIFGVLCISHDLTFIKNVSNKLVQLNQSLKQKNEQLEQSNHELASFSYVASHDLQEPLRKIQTFVSRIMEKEYESLSPQGTEYFKRTDLAAKRMQRLIDDLLTFSRTNTQPKNFKEVDLNQILEEVKSEIKETIDEKNATIHSVILPVATVINFQFHQLIENLLLNALKYNKPGIPPQITITCSRYEGSNSHLVKGTYYQIDFKDNGIGFEQQYHNKIFELFQRLHGKSEYPGSGLGLAICKRIMQNHKGAITAQGVPGEGSTFTVYLPVNE